MEYVAVLKAMKDKLNLKQLILLLSLFGVLVTLLNVFYSMYRVQHELIVSNAIESNRVYAKKMAEMTDIFMGLVFSQLEYSAHMLSDELANERFLQQEVDRLKKQTDFFNAVVIVNAQGVIVSVSPETVAVKSIQLTDERSHQILTSQAPMITNPFLSPAGNNIISLSYPIFSQQGQYLGYIAGGIYLEHDNILMTILGKHAHQDGSYLYVVDDSRTLIHHPNKDRVGEVVLNNEVIDAVMQAENGGARITNSQGIDMLVGFAPVKHSGWGIVVQRSESLALSILNEQMWRVLLNLLPIGAMTLLIIWVLSFFISKPLWQLASAVKNFESHSSLKTRHDLNAVRPWYFEASHLKQSFVGAFNIVSHTIDRLHLDTLTDPLTGLLNRRGLETAINNLRVQNTPFSVLALDIDHFKMVNDTFGHDAGDELLKVVATLIKVQAQDIDMVCRSGGEEFLVFLTNVDGHKAVTVAEDIRQSIATHSFAFIDTMTISIGVASWSGQGESISGIIENADFALYQAKNNGRNRTEHFEKLNQSEPVSMTRAC